MRRTSPSDGPAEPGRPIVLDEWAPAARASWALACQELGLPADVETFERLWHFLRLTLQIARVHNITGVREPEDAWNVLVLQSLVFMPALLAHLPASQAPDGGEPARLADVGSGAGVPGVPIVLSWPRGGPRRIRLTAIECRKKKADSLTSIGAELGIVLEVYPERAEDVGRMQAAREQFDAVVIRALGSFSEVLEYGLPLARKGGIVLVAKSLSQIDEELPAGRVAAQRLGGDDVVVDLVKVAGRTTALVSVRKTSATAKAFPRRAGLPRQEPLGGKPRQ